MRSKKRNSKKRSDAEQRHAVLVVDDDPMTLGLMERALQKEFKVYTATSAESAFATLRNKPLSVIICDHHLPGEDGLSLLTKLGRTNKKVQRILMTGDSSRELILQAVNDGRISKFIPKPCEPSELRSTVRDATDEFQRVNSLEDASQKLKSIGDQSSTDSSLNMKKVWVLTLHFFSVLGGSLLILLGGGVLIILILYFLKSFLGLDLMPDAHFSDIIKFF